MYKVIGATRSRTFRVLWMLEELGLDYDHEPAAPRSDEALAHNPLGKVPALVNGEGEVLTDSVAIMTYLGDRHGALTAPAATVARARQDAMTMWLVDEMDAVLWAAAKHSFVLPEEERQPAIKEQLKREFERSAAVLAKRLTGPFLMGEEMTLTDILAVHCLNWAIGAKFPRVDDDLFAYGQRLRQRPAFIRASAR
ncbi:glutathione S-transferase family protein [Sulfitobacter sp. D35]|uniref:glutathione S-transferase family protein n=1 Tax=Sulfitobacter sp. D35 TaxID=3083252 RepID=UPI00296E8603|nr:glutathione S-transferase family protein [Sulfitobacter sp. D35]MDW4498333.1 glutathione S-transferase family protein [Sulfitobacter sp. D35]